MFKSRKFVLSVAAFLAGTVAFFVGKMPSTEWIELAKWVILLYAGANVAQKKVQS